MNFSLYNNPGNAGVIFMPSNFFQNIEVFLYKLPIVLFGLCKICRKIYKKIMIISLCHFQFSDKMHPCFSFTFL